MRVTIFGTGYVGLVTGACLSNMGNQVLCMDLDQTKIDGLKQGVIPIYEPGLDAIVQETTQSGHLRFTTDAEEAVAFGEIQLIAVGTPPDEDGSADLQHVLAVANTIGELMSDDKIVVDKSTVPVGTADRVQQTIQAQLDKRAVRAHAAVVSNPEFLKEGAAVDDCMRPDRIILGSDDEDAIAVMKALYAPFNRNHDKIIVMDVRSAELTKYAANAMLATKISFMNDMANLAERVGADIELVRQGIGSDPRIGFSFIYPGCGYGGSCFPKDVKALVRTAGQHDYNMRVLDAVEAVNQDQKHRLFERITEFYRGLELSSKTFAIWGLSFKPNTDDMRDATSIELVRALCDAGARVCVFDPEAMDEARHEFSDLDSVIYAESAQDAVSGADALAVVTEWKSFWSPDFELLAKTLTDRVIFDGRNIYDPDVVAEAGIAYYGIGRGLSVSRPVMSS